jgi:nucleoside-diphosphate-sugar epimerase
LLALVTGAGGFLGRYMVELLIQRGDQVRAIARSKYSFLQELGVEQIQGDIRDRASVEKAVEGVEIVYHTAAVAGIWGSWSHYHGINTLGTLHLLEACHQFQVPRFVYTSSPSVTFAGKDQCGIDESEPYPARFLCYYPQTKALAEQAVLQANDSRNFLTCALRPHLIWGPRDQHLIPRLLTRARSGQLRQIGSGKNLVDMIYVENAALAHLQAADALQPNAAVCGRAYFLSQGEPVNCWDWINQILQLAHLPPLKKQISARAAYVAGAMLEGVWTLLGRTDEPRMTRFLAAQLSTHHWFNLTRAREDFGYHPTISIEEGMNRLRTWIQHEKI